MKIAGVEAVFHSEVGVACQGNRFLKAVEFHSACAVYINSYFVDIYARFGGDLLVILTCQKHNLDFEKVGEYARKLAHDYQGLDLFEFHYRKD